MIIEVGSASIGVALVETNGKEKPVLSHGIRTPVESGDNLQASLASAVQATLKEMLLQLQKSGSPKSVQVILAAPWYHARLKTLVSKIEKTAPLSTTTIASTVRAYHEKNEGNTAFPAGTTPIESVVTQGYVNGYQTLLEKVVHGNTLKIELYESSADSALVSALTSVMEEVFHGAKISFHSFPLTAFVVLRSLRSEEGFIFIDIGGEVTDVAIVHKDGFRFLGSFPRGANTLLSDVGKGKDRSEAASRLSLYARGELSSEAGASFAPAFQRSALAWNKEYEALLEKAVADVPIPRTAFVIADKEELQWFEKVIATEGTRIFPIYPIMLSANFFQSAITLGDGGAYDAFLSLGALFFHTERKELIELNVAQ